MTKFIFPLSIAYLLGLLAGLPGTAMAQAFLFRATVQPVAKAGFYRIALPMEVLGQLNADRSDIRLFDEKQQEIPYLLKREEPVQITKLFREYEIVSKTIQPKTATTLVLRNAAKNRINNLSLFIKNANVRKKARLSGSADAQNWYVIEEAYTLEAVNSSIETAELKILNFPLSDYEYYQLEINDSTSAPLNILQVGYYDLQTENGKYSEVPGLTFTQKDSSTFRQSFVRIAFPQPVRIDKLTWEVREPAFYRRNASLQVEREYTDKKGRKRRIQEPVQTWELHSAKDHTAYFSDLTGKNFSLVIENEDNAPLRIGQLKAYFLNVYLIAELKPSRSYYLAFADPALAAPSYDLAYFQDQIPAKLATVAVDKAVKIGTQSPASPTFFTNRLIIWLAIGLVITVLSFLSFRMLQEVGKNKSAGS